MILRLASSSDAAALAALGRESFLSAFGHLYAKDDLDAFLAAHKTEAAYSAKLADPGTRAALAEIDGSPAGFCILSQPSEFTSHSDAINPVALQQLYTDPCRIGEGIGARLMDWALAEARALEADAIQLSVWSGNVGAQRFYARYGFAKIADIEFLVGTHRDEEFLLELRLSARVRQTKKC